MIRELSAPATDVRKGEGLKLEIKFYKNPEQWGLMSFHVDEGIHILGGGYIPVPWGQKFCTQDPSVSHLIYLFVWLFVHL